MRAELKRRATQDQVRALQISLQSMHVIALCKQNVKPLNGSLPCFGPDIFLGPHSEVTKCPLPFDKSGIQKIKTSSCTPNTVRFSYIFFLPFILS